MNIKNLKIYSDCNINELKAEYDELYTKMRRERDNKLIKMVEEGKNGKPYTELHIAVDKNGETAFVEYARKQGKSDSENTNYKLLWI